MPIVRLGDRLRSLLIKWLVAKLPKLLKGRAESLVVLYNAPLSTATKATVFNAFQSGEILFIITTIAFSFSVNPYNVKWVV